MPVGHASVRRGALLLALAVALAGTATPLLAATPAHAASAGTTTASDRATSDTPRTGGFTIDTNLLSSSGLSAWAIDRYLAANTPLPPIGAAFKAAELKYGVNARYLLAHAMLETAFGTSYFALNHRNLFGWTAFDRDPGKFATRFPTYADGVDYVASRIHDWYLVPDGRFYGGASTLRGMDMYASDPGVEQGIARIANLMAIPTLAGRDFEIGRPEVKGTVFAGGTVTVTVEIDAADGGGALADGLRIATRWRPVAIVETSAPAETPPPARPDFELVSGRTTGGNVVASVVAPDLPGRYRLELQIRDSDGTPLGDGSRIAIPGLAVRVHAIDAVAYDLDQTADGLAITISNVGRQSIFADGTGKAAATLSTVAVWSLPRRGSPALLTRIPLASNLPPGGEWTGVIPVEVLEDAFPGMLLLRLEVAGSPGRLLTSPPGVFQVDVVSGGAPAESPPPSPTSTPQPDPAAQPDPSPAGASPAGASTSSVPHVSASADAAADERVVLPELKIRAITPGDPASATLLKPAGKAKSSANSKAADAKVQIASTAISTSGKPVRAARYEPFLGVNDGRGTVLVTNTGTVTYHREAPDPGTGDGSNPGVTSLLITAIPATGGRDAPIVLRFPLTGDLEPGEQLEVPIRLPAIPGVQPTYLVSARLATADPEEQPTPAAVVFWMRGAPASQP